MKRLLIILLFALSLFTYGQNYNDREKKTTLNDNDGVFVHDITANKTYGVAWSDIANYMFGANRTYNYILNITGQVQAPSVVAPGLDRGFGYQSGLFGWNNSSGTFEPAASRSWTLALLAGYDVAIDTTQFAQVDANNNFTGSNTMNSLLLSSVSIGLTTNSGKSKMPVYTLENVPTSPAIGSFHFNSTYDRFKIYDGTNWLPFLDSAAVAAIAQTGGALLPSSGTLSGISSLLYFSTGGIRYVSTATGYSSTSARAGMPVYTSLPAVTNHYNGDFATLYGQSDTDGSGEDLHGIYFLYVDQDYNKHWGFAPDQDKVERIVKKNYKYEAPENVTASSDTLYFGTEGDNNYRKAIYTVPQNGLTIYLDNSGTGAVSIVVWGTQEDVTIQSVASEIIQYSGGIKPTFDYASGTNNNKKWLLTFTRDGDGYIDCQWNWVQKEQ